MVPSKIALSSTHFLHSLASGCCSVIISDVMFCRILRQRQLQVSVTACRVFEISDLVLTLISVLFQDKELLEILQLLLPIIYIWRYRNYCSISDISTHSCGNRCLFYQGTFTRWF